MRRIVAVILTLMLTLPLIPFATAEEPVTLRVFSTAFEDCPTEDNPIYKKIEEQFGVRFDFTFLTGDLDATLEQMIADNKYDLIDGGSSAGLLAESGMLINLLDYINPEQTPRLWEHIEPQMLRLTEKDAEGNNALYIIPREGLWDGGEIVNNVSDNAFFVQKQVLAWDNYPEIRTVDEYFDLLRRFLKAHPTDGDGKPYTGFAIMCEGFRDFCLTAPVQNLMGYPNDRDVIVDNASDDFRTETYIDKPYAKLYYRKLNRAYHDGLISAGTFDMTHEQYMDLVAGGTVLGMYDVNWDISFATNALMDAGQYDRTYVALGIVYNEEDAGKEVVEHYLRGSQPVREGYGISTACACPELVVAMWEELLSEEWQLLFNWGIEGRDYSIDSNGRLQMTPEQYANRQDSEWRQANQANALFLASPKRQGWILNDVSVGNKVVCAGNCWEPENQPEILLSRMNDYDREFLEAYGYSRFTDFLNSPAEAPLYGDIYEIKLGSVSDAWNRFREIQHIRLPELIMCDEAEFDEKWDAFTEEIKPFAEEYGNYVWNDVTEQVFSFFADI